MEARECLDLVKALTIRVEKLEREVEGLKIKRTKTKKGQIDGRTTEGRELLLKRLIEDDEDAPVGRSTKKTCRDGKPDMRTIEGRSLWAAMERERETN
jgi:hypothetical protein